MKPNFNFKYYQEFRLISLVIILYLITNYLVLIIGNTLEDYQIEYKRFHPATILLIMIFGGINSFLHKIPFLWKLLMKVPLIRGNYEGNIMYLIDGKEIEKKCKMKIYQTTSKIKVDTTFWNEDENGKKIETTITHSESLVEDFLKNQRDNYELHFYYSNEGNFNRTIETRMGYNILKYDKDTKSFEGVYFSRNSITDGNGGKISVEFKQKL